MITILTLFSGGTGTPKLLQGLKELIPEEEISVVVNTGEDVEVSGVKVSPDLDTVVYTMADIIDDDKWYGIKEDTFQTHDMLRRLGHKELLKMGDKDRAVKLYRTFRMREGSTLSEVTEEICGRLGIQANIMPMTNDSVSTRIDTENGEMPFHEFWVERGGNDRVSHVNFVGSENAGPAPGVIEALEESHSIIIGPSNPVTSLGPILAIEDIDRTLRKNKEKVIAVSPVIGDSPVSGPTGVLMDGLGFDVNPDGVAEIYEDFVGSFIIHEGDSSFISDIEDRSMNVFLQDILIPDFPSRKKLAQEILEIINYQSL